MSSPSDPGKLPVWDWLDEDRLPVERKPQIGVEPFPEILWLGTEWLVKEVDGLIVTVLPMIYNDRVCITDRAGHGKWYLAGWCYEKGGAALHAAQLWNPLTERTPVGFKKEAYDRREETP